LTKEIPTGQRIVKKITKKKRTMVSKSRGPEKRRLGPVKGGKKIRVSKTQGGKRSPKHTGGQNNPKYRTPLKPQATAKKKRSC